MASFAPAWFPPHRILNDVDGGGRSGGFQLEIRRGGVADGHPETSTRGLYDAAVMVVKPVKYRRG